ncbi:lipase family protein [Caballeronia sp. 15715]|uniref:lipase family protein n=1 Tax=Caballeronia sp. 15715 TaxID=3391030 RepID=UPI0039E30552
MSIVAPSPKGLIPESILRFWRNMSQRRDQVLVRNPGERIYGAPLPVAQEAFKHWECALLSQLAYINAETIKAQIRKVPLDDVQGVVDPVDPVAALKHAGWEFLDTFPSLPLDARFKRANLRVEVWAKEDRSTIAIAFGGTVATSLADWRSNLRWVLPKHPDEYSLTVRYFVPDFIRVLKELKLSKAPTIFATGHSLGGGLAQQFAYALPDNFDEQGILSPRVIQVFAFDPSPVTGFYSLKEATRTRNARELKTDRVFERGEILASLRSLLALVQPPSKEHPAIRTVRYNYLGITWPVHAHSISQFAKSLYGTVRSSLSGQHAQSTAPNTPLTGQGEELVEVKSAEPSQNAPSPIRSGR